MRLCAGLNVPLELIEPFGFPWNERKIRESAMDYFDHVTLQRHASWEAFRQNFSESRVVLLTTKSDLPYTNFRFRESDILLLGRESAGVPAEIHAQIPDRVTIPMAPAIRSFNVAMAGAIVLSEALRQISCQAE